MEQLELFIKNTKYGKFPTMSEEQKALQRLEYHSESVGNGTCTVNAWDIQILLRLYNEQNEYIKKLIKDKISK